MNTAREEILGKVRTALGKGRAGGSPAVPVVPDSARVGPRQPGDRDAEIDSLLAEVDKLTGVTRRIARPEELKTALAELVEAEGVKKAALWQTQELRDLGVGDALAALGVTVVPGCGDKREIAECDLGVTGVDLALPETGTIILRSSPQQPRGVSLIPRVHLALVRPPALRADLHQALADVKDGGYAIAITGPSRTADIELIVTVGVHGPKALYVWSVEY